MKNYYEQLIKSRKGTVKFLITGIGLYIMWSVIMGFPLNQGEPINNKLTWFTAMININILNTLDGGGYSFVQNSSKAVITKDSFRVLGIDHKCNGLALMAVLAWFILTFPGPWKARIKFIFFGFASIFILNQLRILALIWMRFHYPAMLDFNHKYTFTFLLYAFVFFLWMKWVNYPQPLNKKISVDNFLIK